MGSITVYQCDACGHEERGPGAKPFWHLNPCHISIPDNGFYEYQKTAEICPSCRTRLQDAIEAVLAPTEAEAKESTP